MVNSPTRLTIRACSWDAWTSVVREDFLNAAALLVGGPSCQRAAVDRCKKKRIFAEMGKPVVHLSTERKVQGTLPRVYFTYVRSIQARGLYWWQ